MSEMDSEGGEAELMLLDSLYSLGARGSGLHEKCWINKRKEGAISPKNI
jgi:hypothetical protein